MPIVLPIGDMLPMGELVPLLLLWLRLPEHSRSENDEFLVDEQPRELEPERESLERYDDEPVVVLPLTLEVCGSRPRGGTTSEGDRSVGSAHIPACGIDEGVTVLDIEDEMRCEWAGLVRGIGIAVESRGDGTHSCSGKQCITGDCEGLLSYERSCRSSTAPFSSFTTTTGISVPTCLSVSVGLGLGLGRQLTLLATGMLSAAASE